VIAARAEVDAARLMRQAADILASPAAMQIRQLEAREFIFGFCIISRFLISSEPVQQMAKSANSKVVFVPMQLQSDLGGASGSGLNSLVQNAEASGSDQSTLGAAGRIGVLNSITDV